jgi:AraC-like DNA-binding protein
MGNPQVMSENERMGQMRYRDWANLNISLLWCYDRTFLPAGTPAGASLGSAEFKNSGAWLVREGWAQVCHDNRTTRAQPGQWLIVKPAARTQQFAPATRLLSVAFDAHWPDGVPLFSDGLSVVVDAADVPELERDALRILRLTNRLDPFASGMQDNAMDLERFVTLERAMFKWFGRLSGVLSARGVHHSGRPEIDARVIQATRLLRAHDLREPLHLGRLAASVGLSLSQLIRLFRRDMRTTPREYFEHLRVEHACMRLRWPQTRIKTVAIELGFTYLSHFSKWFRKHTGSSPRQFAKAGTNG